MPIQKTFTANNGVATGYHVIGKMELDFFANKTRVSVYSYVSKAIFDGGQDRYVDGKNFELNGTGNLAWAYQQIKAQVAQFSDATDVS